MKNKIIKIFELVLTSVLVTILFLTLSPLIPFSNFPRSFIVVSGSMEPTIKTGSIAFTTIVEPKTLVKGDIIAFTSPNNPKDTILHRIDNIKSTIPLRFSTKGDNNNSADAWDVMDVAIKGKYNFSLPYIGHIGAFVRKPLGFVLIIIIPALFFVIQQILLIKKTINQEINRKVSESLKNTPLIILFLTLTTCLGTIGAIKASYSDTAKINGVYLSTSDYVAPEIPVLISPDNNSIIYDNDISIDWGDVSDYKNQHNPVYYLYQSANNPEFNNAYTSDKLSDSKLDLSGTKGYVYYWRVKACDSLDNCSPWSNYFSFGISGETDTIPPTTEIIDLPYVTNHNPLNIVYYSSDTDINNVDLCYSYNLGQYFCHNNLLFNFPHGDGTYYFYTQATDDSGNTEDSKPYYLTGTVFDTIAPTTNLLLNSTIPTYSGHNLLDSTKWEFVGVGHTQVDNSIQLGIGDSDAIDILVQKILLPHNLSSNFTFSFNYSSADTAEFDNFNVKISNGVTDTDILNVGGTGTTGWLTISHSLLQWAGQTIDIIFKLVNSSQDYLLSSNVLLKDINISPLDLRTGDTAPPQFLATDLGSGILSTTNDLNNISSTDVALNSEASHSIDIVKIPQVALNKISSDSVDIYNNTNSIIDLTDWTIDVGTTTVLSGNILPYSARNIILDLSLSNTIKLINNNSITIDSTTFDISNLSVWQRTINGLGPWTKTSAPLFVNLESRKSQSKITLTISGIGDTSINMDYTINYSSSNIQQQIAGTILPHTVDSNGFVSRDFFLGTCSTAVCNSALNIGSTISVTFSNLEPKMFNYN